MNSVLPQPRFLPPRYLVRVTCAMAGGSCWTDKPAPKHQNRRSGRFGGRQPVDRCDSQPYFAEPRGIHSGGKAAQGGGLGETAKLVSPRWHGQSLRKSQSGDSRGVSGRILPGYPHKQRGAKVSALKLGRSGLSRSCGVAPMGSRPRRISRTSQTRKSHTGTSRRRLPGRPATGRRALRKTGRCHRR